jgi:hypothetical protein
MSLIMLEPIRVSFVAVLRLQVSGGGSAGVQQVHLRWQQQWQQGLCSQETRPQGSHQPVTAAVFFLSEGSQGEELLRTCCSQHACLGFACWDLWHLGTLQL